MKKNSLRLGFWILIGGLFYYLVIRYTHFSIPCLFYSTTHLKCPGCGVTRMIVECSFFRFKAAAKYNYFLFFTSPVIAYIILYEFFFKKKGKAIDKISNAITIAYMVALLIWMVLRNIYHL